MWCELLFANRLMRDFRSQIHVPFFFIFFIHFFLINFFLFSLPYYDDIYWNEFNNLHSKFSIYCYNLLEFLL